MLLVSIYMKSAGIVITHARACTRIEERTNDVNNDAPNTSIQGQVNLDLCHEAVSS